MENHLYVISFTVGSESGLALVAAQDDKSAFQILKNGGSRHCDGYSLVQIRDIGMTCDCHYGLLMESFVNALVAYDAIMNAANKLVGPKGDKGDDGLAVDAVKYTSQSLTDDQKSQARNNIGATTPEVFWATFEETPYLDVLDAHNSGKLCVCKYNGHMYYLSGFYKNVNDIIYFDELGGSFNEDSTTLTVFVRSDDSWDYETGYFVVGENSATDWNDKYTKPTTGIPASDIASDVIPASSVRFVVPMVREEEDDVYSWSLGDGVTMAQVHAAYLSGNSLVIKYDIAGILYDSPVMAIGDDIPGLGLAIYFVNGDNGKIETATI